MGLLDTVVEQQKVLFFQAVIQPQHLLQEYKQIKKQELGKETKELQTNEQHRRQNIWQILATLHRVKVHYQEI